jgi:hypothetical protein
VGYKGSSEFADMRREVIASTIAFGDANSARSPVSQYPKKANQLIAAAVLVASERGIDWCAANPEAYAQATISNLGLWLKLAIWVGSLFLGGSGIWWTLASWILPSVIDWFVSREASGAFGASEFDTLKSGATYFLEHGV